MSKKKLGRGLDALLSSAASISEVTVDSLASEPANELAVDVIERSRYQPRREFEPQALDELAASIKAQGLLQPVVVRPRPNGRFELIAGERRWRAAQLAGLSRIPVVVRDVSDEQASAMALIENVQREDLNPLEEAYAFERLREEFGLTQQQVADAVGKSRVAVANLLRLLNLTPKVRDMLMNGDLEMGHARALLGLETADQENAALTVVEKQLSVRQTESLVKSMGQPRKIRPAQNGVRDPDTVRLEQELTDRIGAPVAISHNDKGKGTVVIRYASLDELDGILSRLK